MAVPDPMVWLTAAAVAAIVVGARTALSWFRRRRQWAYGSRRYPDWPIPPGTERVDVVGLRGGLTDASRRRLLAAYPAFTAPWLPYGRAGGSAAFPPQSVRRLIRSPL